MPPPSTLASRLKVQLKLSISRLRMVQQKDTAIAKQQRRAMAQLLEQNKIESARIRVENIILSDITTELLEILELYCELLLARLGLLDPSSPSLSPASSHPPSSTHSSHNQPLPDPGLLEAVASIIYAAPRTEIKELHTVRALLVEKFGKDFAAGAMEAREGAGVAERVVSKLRVQQPSRELVDGYLTEIARAYGVDWPPPTTTTTEGDGGEDDDGEGGDGGAKERELEAPLEAEELRGASPPQDLGPKSPLRVVPPSPSTDNPKPQVKGTGGLELRPNAKMRGVAGDSKKSDMGVKGKDEQKVVGKGKDVVGGKIPDVDELARRFADLKR